MITNNKLITVTEAGSQVNLKAYIAFAMLCLGLIAFNYITLIEWIMSQSIFTQLFLLTICLVVGYIFFAMIMSTLSLNYYGDTALEITVDKVMLGKSLDAKIRLGKHLNIEDKFDVKLINMYYYIVRESAYGESFDSTETDIIWSKEIVVNVIKEEDEFLLVFSFDLSADEGQVETRQIKKGHGFSWEIVVSSNNIKYGFYRTYKISVKKDNK